MMLSTPSTDNKASALSIREGHENTQMKGLQTFWAQILGTFRQFKKLKLKGFK